MQYFNINYSQDTTSWLHNIGPVFAPRFNPLQITWIITNSRRDLGEKADELLGGELVVALPLGAGEHTLGQFQLLLLQRHDLLLHGALHDEPRQGKTLLE